MNTEKLLENLAQNGMEASYFDTAEQAASAICQELKGQKIAFGGSMTLKEMGIYEKLKENNSVFWHWITKTAEQKQAEFDAEVYITSVNAMAETGEIVNIDGNCNRISNSVYGCKRVYFVLGANKITPDLHTAIYRARNFAAPKNAARLGAKTPCAVDGKCHDCKSEGRICKVMNIIMQKPSPIESMRVIIIGKQMGY